MGRGREPYSGTQVPVSRTQEKIRQLFLQNGGIGFQFTEFPVDCIIEVKFARKIIVNGVPHTQPLRFRISHKGRRVEQVYRALYFHLKAKFEIVRFGIISFEEEFLPYFEMQLPGGKSVTIAEVLVPDLKKALPPALEPMQNALPSGGTSQ